ncbi:MAG: DNA polymerase III subunit alpha, partial [Bacteroidia bacterium]
RLSPWKRETERLLAYKRMTLWAPEDAETHYALRCIDANCLSSTLPAGHEAAEGDWFTRYADALKPFEEAPDLVRNAERMLEGGDWQFDWNEPQNRKTYTGDPDEDFRMMRDLAVEGLKYRYPKYTYATTQRLEKEMKSIYELGFTAYFLINWDICRYAREQGFFYIGRGSGANSMVAYCLRITDVDPIELDLYFERFINPFRSSPPDFDIDFSWQDRDRVTGYILAKYGPDHASLLGTYNTFQTNAVVRELGKVYGLPKHDIDHLLNKPSYYSPSTFEEYTAPNPSDIYSQPGVGKRVRSRKLGRGNHSHSENQHQKHSLFTQVIRLAQRIHNLPNYRSLHVGGILISHKSLHHFSPLELPPKGFPSVQFSMLEAEDLGLAKFDILSQRGLGHIKDTVLLVAENRGETIDPHRVQYFKLDPRIARMLKGGFTMGCFYVESPAMRQLLRKLKCDDYPTLVAASSVIRPGVAQSGMMRSFIERHVRPEKRSEAHPVLHAIMPETYGIMVYQEDVIRVAHEFAGLGLAESDILRRGMSGKFRSKAEFERVKERFFELAQEKGHPLDLVGSVWSQIESFAGYSFAKGHSASYAVESYQSLHLKAYYPLEFYTAVINNFGGFYRTEFYVHAARMCGARIEAPCINHSRWLTHLEGETL